MQLWINNFSDYRYGRVSHRRCGDTVFIPRSTLDAILININTPYLFAAARRLSPLPYLVRRLLV